MKISILTPSYRPEGLAVVANSILKQSFPLEEVEWIICSPMDPTPSLPAKIIPRLEWLVDSFKKQDPNLIGVLNVIYNHMLRHAQGELIVSIQDWIWFPPDTLQRFWDHHEAFKSNGIKAYVTGVGDQYEGLNRLGKPEVLVWEDPRRHYWSEEFYECPHDNIEANFCYYPKQLFYDIGGWDEQLDYLGYGMDNVSVSQRAQDAGWKAFMDKTIECRAVYHTRNEMWDSLHNINGNYQKRLLEIKMLPTYPKLNYLT